MRATPSLLLSLLLPTGLLISGALGFWLGARPALAARFFPGSSQLSETEKARMMMDLLFPLAVAFFAGFVFSTLVPDALTHSAASIAAFAAGIGVMAVLSRLVFKRDPCCEVGHDHRGFGAVSLLAMTVCSVNDGLLIGLLDPAWFSGLNIGMLIHKVTSSFAVAQVMRSSRFRGWGLAAFGTAYTLVSPAALLAARSPLGRSLPGHEEVLAFSAGLLAYVTLANLVPHARGIMRRRPRVAYGFVFAFLLSISLGIWHTALHKRFDRGTAAAAEP